MALGQIVGYIEPNWAGKTITVKILFGMLPNFLGQVLVCGYNISFLPFEVK